MTVSFLKHARRRARRRKRITRRPPAGSSPGILLAQPQAVPTKVECFCYGPDGFEEHEIQSAADIDGYRGHHPFVWLNVDGMANVDLIREIGEKFSIHRLALEDVIVGSQRPKVEHYEDHLFIVGRMLTIDEHLSTEQLSLFLGRNFLVTFQEVPGDCLEPVRARLRGGRGRIRSDGPDYLAYAILDAVIDAYFPPLERLGEALDELEDQALTNYRSDIVSSLHDSKRDLLSIRRAIWPLREVVNTLIRDHHTLVAESTRLYLRDCYDHTVQLIDLVETLKELGSDLVSLALTLNSNRLNEIMKVLTIIATIFIPLTFISGLYGMNFNTEVSPYNMPELNSRYGYPAVLLVMLVVALFQLLFFWRNGWIFAATSAMLRKAKSKNKDHDSLPPAHQADSAPTRTDHR